MINTSADLRTVPIEHVRESPTNPRKHFEPGKLHELAASIRESGVLNPLLVRDTGNGKGPSYELVDGARRFRASQEAGLGEVPVLVRDLSDQQVLEIQIISNLQRDDLNALEEAQGFVTLMKDAGYDVPKIAERVGRSVKYVYDRIKLLQLVPEAKKLLTDGTITPGHGILLARLSKDDQKRALEADDGSYRSGGLLEREQINDSYFAQEPELDLEYPKKARSVRELQQWIDRNVRFNPAKVDQADLAFDLPKTAELLDTAAAKKLKVVKITREYRVPDEARDEKERTYGVNGWKRADGEPETDPYGKPEDAKPSKTCDRSVVGLVVAGPGRGEAFLVCVNKDKCSIHWAKEMKEKAQRAKSNGKAAAAPKEQVDSWEVQQARRRKRAAELQPARTAVVDAVLAKVEHPLPTSILRFVALRLADSWGSRKLLAKLLNVDANSTSKIQGVISGLDAAKLAKVIVAGLIGQEAEISEHEPDAKPEDLLDLCHVYGVDLKKITAQVQPAAKAKAVQTSGKPKAAGKKKRAGDVARERRKKKAKAAK